MNKINKNDALGNKIVIGNRYGFVTGGSGVKYIRIGIAVKISDKTSRVTIATESLKSAVYDFEAEVCDDTYYNRKVNVAAHAIVLFPVP